MFKRIVIAIAVVLIIGSGFVIWKMMEPPPDGLDLSETRQSAKGLYTVSFTPEGGVVEKGPIHVWLAEVKDQSGSAVSGAEISIDGGMPQHGHGLPTSPGVVGEVSPGVYRVDGVKFSMGGWWEFKLNIKAAPGGDEVVFNRVVE